jgi:hypothetical protein
MQQVPYQGHESEPLLLTDRADAVPEPFPVQGNDLEHERNAVDIKAVVLAWRQDVRMRKPGAADAAGQRDNKSNTVRVSHDNRRPDSPLFMPFCISKIDKPDVAVFFSG